MKHPGETELRTLAESSPEPAGPAPMFVLRVMSGPDAGKTRVLDWNVAPRVTVGQSLLSELPLTDRSVSRRHVALSPAGHRIRVTDLDSTNGTRIGGIRMIDALLEGGESIEVGDTTLKLVRAGNVPEASTPPRGRFGRVLGHSVEMQRLFALAERLSQSPLPLLLEGETGTGKELLAEAVHENGPRAQYPMVVFDPSAYSGDAELVALFGREQAGAIEQANGGTLVIDEASSLSDAAQMRLAAFMERGILQRIGQSVGVRADVRIIATTRRDLERLVQEGSFREELLYRLAGARLEVPPLHERKGDIDVLARHFWSLFGGQGDLPRTFALTLGQHSWPGNVRELENAVAKRVQLGDDLSALVRPQPVSSTHKAADYMETVLDLNLAMPNARQMVIDEFEQRYVDRAVAAHGGNISRAAAASGLTRRYFHMLRSKAKTRPQK